MAKKYSWEDDHPEFKDIDMQKKVRKEFKKMAGKMDVSKELEKAIY